VVPIRFVDYQDVNAPDPFFLVSAFKLRRAIATFAISSNLSATKRHGLAERFRDFGRD
jgi:hypothetical protein